MMKYIVQRSCLILVLVATVAGCQFSRLEDDLSKMRDIAHSFSGTVSTERLEADAIVVVALRDRQGGDIATFRMMSGPGSFDVRTRPAPTFIFGFEDLNKDLSFQADEPYGWAAGGQAVDPSKEATDNLSIAIAADSRPEFPQQLIDESLVNHVSDDVRFNIGSVTPLDAPLFSEEQAKKGLWEPFAFMVDGGAGIHFLQPYDAGKVPVLFVHGINGTPQNFTALIENLDRSRFQAWVYSYPSGLRLPQLANGMYQFLQVLHRQLRFDELHLVAHSMGGLVSRGGVNMCIQNDTCDYLRSYTTLSTPWNGVASAQSGVDWAPTVVPVWRDMVPSSDYAMTLFDTPLPYDLPYFLMFGFKQNSIFGSESSDGVIK